MTADHVQMVAMSIQNQLGVWMTRHQDCITTEGADRAYHALRRKRAERFTLDTAIEDFYSFE